MTERAVMLALFLLGGCAANPTRSGERAYVALSPHLQAELTLPDFVKLVHFTPERPPRAAARKAVDRDGDHSRDPDDDNTTQDALASPDDWLFAQPRHRYVAQLFSARTRLLAMQQLQTLGVTGWVFYSPTDRRWFALRDRSYPTADAARQGAGTLTSARDGDLVIRRVDEAWRWRCKDLAHQSDQSSTLDGLCP